MFAISSGAPIRRAGVLRGAVIAGLLVLTACGSVREDLGLERTAPDEFRATSRAPLTLPPDFNVRPPRPGTDQPQQRSPTERAFILLYQDAAARPSEVGERSSLLEGRPEGEQELLRRSGALRANPSIRQIVTVETSGLALARADFLRRLLTAEEGGTRPGLTIERVEGGD